MYQSTYKMLEQSSAEQTGQISEHLIKAAKIITDFFQTPSNFLEFLSKTIWRIDNYRIMKKEYSRDVHSYLENMMIDGIVQPWLKNEGDVQLKIAQGLKEISDQFGSEYLKMVQLIEKAIDDYADEFEPEYAYIKNLLLSVSTLYDIAPLLLQDYEESQKEKFLILTYKINIMKKVTTNRNQIRMDKIANDMAVLFEEKTTASSLAEWIALINQGDNNPKSIKELIWAFGFMLLPSFIKCNTKAQRIEFLKKDLTGILNEYTDMAFRESLGDIGIKFCTESKKGGSFPEEIQEFMQIYTTLLIICEMNDGYVFLEKELKEEIEKS